MTKKIVLFSDGTGNSSSKTQKTNVWRAYQALDRRPESGQIAFYDNGVGTSPFRPVAVLGLAFGFGLARNVKQIYRFVCQTYRDGDEIYGFGFSRGAFTMRVVAALICHQGIINVDKAQDEHELDRWVAAAYHRFRKESFTPSLLSSFLRPIRDFLFDGLNKVMRRRPYEPGKPERNFGYLDPSTGKRSEGPIIKFVGVWDTVDAYGLPVDELTRAWDMVVWPLTAKDRDCSPRIERACHALALDEQRESFEPALWNEHGRKLTRTIDDEHVTQVWFAGVHSNVGGSYPDDSLALVPLNWMLGQSEKKGLTFLPDERQRFLDQANWRGPLYDSRSGAGMFYRYAPRHLERLCRQKKPGLANWLKPWLPGWFIKGFGIAPAEDNDVIISKPKIHHSVFKRIKESGDAYAPMNLPETYVVVDDQGKIADFETAEALMPETTEQADDRRTRQAYLWNKVWGLKVLYLLTLATVALWIGYPLFRGSPSGRAEAVADSILGVFSDAVRGIPSLVGKIPGLGFAESWAMTYAGLPYAFVAFLVLIGLLWYWQSRVQFSLKNEMRRAWRHLTGKGAALPDPEEFGGFRKNLADFLDSRMDRHDKLRVSVGSKISRWLRMGSEALAVLVFLFVIVRIGLLVVDGSGGFCDERPDQERGFGEVFVFDADKTCFDTGLELTAGQTYRIEIEISRGWSDATLAADVKGWSELSMAELDVLKKSGGEASPDKKEEEAFQAMVPIPWYMYLATPLRRHLLADWYAPMARGGDTFFDWHELPALATDDDGDVVPRPTRLCAELEPRRSGRLYLYLNDAVVPLPWLFGWFYGNNNGSAEVTVVAIPEGKMTDASQSAEVGCRPDG